MQVRKKPIVLLRVCAKKRFDFSSNLRNIFGTSLATICCWKHLHEGGLRNATDGSGVAHRIDVNG